jgi:hypothetical protein
MAGNLRTLQEGQIVLLAGFPTQPQWEGLKAKVLAVNIEANTVSVRVNFTKEQSTYLTIGPTQYRPDTTPSVPKVYLVTHPCSLMAQLRGRTFFGPGSLIWKLHLMAPGSWKDKS